MKKLSRYSKISLVVGCGVIIIPIILYHSLSANCGFDFIGGEKAPEVWLGFGASFIGAIASLAMIVVTLFVLDKQLSQNQEQNSENKQLQLNILKHSNAQRDLEESKRLLVNFQVSFNLLAITSIFGNILNEKYLEEDKNTLTFLIRDIDEKALSLELSINRLSSSQELNRFNILYNEIYNEYCLLIADMMFFIDLMKDLPKDERFIDQYVKYRVEVINKKEREQNRFILLSAGIDISPNIETIIKQIGDYVNIRNNARKIIELRHNAPSSRVADLKESLKLSIKELLNLEQNRIDDILTVTEIEKDNIVTAKQKIENYLQEQQITTQEVEHDRIELRNNVALLLRNIGWEKDDINMRIYLLIHALLSDETEYGFFNTLSKANQLILIKRGYDDICFLLGGILKTIKEAKQQQNLICPQNWSVLLRHKFTPQIRGFDAVKELYNLVISEIDDDFEAKNN